MPRRMMLQDPEDYKEKARRVDPPISMWPGTPKTRDAVLAACGDDRDWFRAMHRIMANRQVWYEWAAGWRRLQRRKRRAKRRRRKQPTDFEWDQVLVLGDYGVGKTTLGAHEALKWFRRGHPVFSNSSFLFGWHLSGQRIFTALGRMPKQAVLGVDEAAAVLSQRVQHGVAVTSFGELLLNTRKKEAKIIIMSAQDRRVSSDIRVECRRVWEPVKPKVEGQGSYYGDPANDPDNFRMVWHEWPDFPYRRANIIDGRDKDREGGLGGPPEDTHYSEGEHVRLSYLLNDSFELARAGTGTTADRNAIKDDLEEYQAMLDSGSFGDPHASKAQSRDNLELERIYDFFEREREKKGRPEYYTASDLAGRLRLRSPSQVGQLMPQAFPGLAPVRRKGFPAAVIFEVMAELEEQLVDG